MFCTQFKIELEQCSLTFYRKGCGFKLLHWQTDSKIHPLSDLSLVCCILSQTGRNSQGKCQVHPNSRDNEKKLSKSWRIPLPSPPVPPKTPLKKVPLLTCHNLSLHFSYLIKMPLIKSKNSTQRSFSVKYKPLQDSLKLNAEASSCQQTKQTGYQVIYNRPRMASCISLKNKMAAKISGVLIDLSGTIHVENTVMPGAIQALKR